MEYHADAEEVSAEEIETMTPANELGMKMIQALRPWIRRRGFNQRRWAAHVGTTEHVISRVLNGRQAVSLDKLLDWADELGCEWHVELRPRRRR